MTCDESETFEQKRNGCTYADVARRGPSTARPEEHIGDTCYTKPRREIARVQGKNRIRTGLRSRETLRRAHAHVCIISGLRSIKFRTSWCRELALSRAADLGTTLHRALRVRDHSVRRSIFHRTGLLG